MLCIVLLNCVALGFETPMNNPNEVKARVLQTRCGGNITVRERNSTTSGV